jgi:hypothetical protein
MADLTSNQHHLPVRPYLTNRERNSKRRRPAVVITELRWSLRAAPGQHHTTVLSSHIVCCVAGSGEREPAAPRLPSAYPQRSPEGGSARSRRGRAGICGCTPWGRAFRCWHEEGSARGGRAPVERRRARCAWRMPGSRSSRLPQPPQLARVRGAMFAGYLCSAVRT